MSSTTRTPRSSAMTDIADKPKVGLILAGGGARAAYQVGVLKAIAEMLPPDCPNPFPILSGTSAGAINATTLAIYAPRVHEGGRRPGPRGREFSPGPGFPAGG